MMVFYPIYWMKHLSFYPIVWTKVLKNF